MRLKVTYREAGASREHRDVAITADARTTPRDVAAALWTGAGHDGPVPPGLTLRVVQERSTRALDPAEPLADSGVASGGVVEVAYAQERSRSRGPAGATLVVVDGPDEGLSVPLPVGSSDVGRSTECDVRLTDPTVSKVHVRINVGEEIEVIDQRSANGIVVGGQRVARVRLGVGDVVELGATTLRITALRGPGSPSSVGGERGVVRPPRVVRRPRPREVALPKVPSPAEPQPFPWLATLAPLIMGVALFVFTQSLMSILFIALSPLLMLGSWVDQRLQMRRKTKAQAAAFRAALASAVATYDDVNRGDVAALEVMHPTASRCLRVVSEPSGLLWTRRPEHPEFLQLRLGTGRRASFLRIGGAEAEAVPELLAEHEQARARLSVVDEAAVSADLREAGGLGVCGEAGRVDDVARALVAQLLALHSPAEVVLVALTSAAGRQRWGWLAWVPHTTSAHSPVAGPHLACDSGAGGALLAALEDLVSTRLAAMRESSHDAGRGPCPDGEATRAPVVPTVVALVDEPAVDHGRLNRVAEAGPDVGVHVIWVARDRALIPAACRTFLDLGRAPAAGEAQVTAGMVRTEAAVTPVRPEEVGPEAALRFGRELAPMLDAGSPADDASDLPRVLPLVTLLDAAGPQEADRIVERWVENASLVDRRDGARWRPFPRDLSALVGYDASAPFAVDLRAHGPHALVGGTTGSGKSEFLQAWVLGLAHAYSPDRLTFLFVDYKGGSAFSRCVELPHCAGLVTDLSPALVRRALTSLRAEIRHREELLQRKGVKDLMELERLGDPECPPSLVIVVDEFAALVTDVPEFVDGMVDVAQRGRSLGLNLVLATQRPEGVIKDNLRANTNLRVALRMSDEHNSVDVLGSPQAAHIDPAIPGRGAVKFGPGRIVPFQSAFPGSRTPAIPPSPPVEVRDLGFGEGRAWPGPPREEVDQGLPTDLERVVAAISGAAERGAVPPPRRPWLPTLAPVYSLERLRQRSDDELVVGVVDDPERQRHVTAYFRPDAEGNILYVGTGGSGKSTALRSLATAASITPRGGPVHVYGLDFAGGALSSLEVLPTVGSIVMGDDDERVARLLRSMAAEVDARRDRYAAVNAATLADYRRIADAPSEPRILLLLDGFSGFRADYDTTATRTVLYDTLLRLLVEGRTAGIHVAMTADRPNAVPVSVASAFQRRLVLRQADEDAYRDLGVPHDVLTASSPPGRCLEVGRGLEMQVPVIGTSLSLAVQARDLARLADVLRPHHLVRPAEIRRLPDLIEVLDLPATVEGMPVLGVEDSALAPIGFEATGAVAVAGPAGSGRTAAVRWLAESLRRAGVPGRLVRVGPRPSPLAQARCWDVSATGVPAAAEALRAVADELDRGDGLDGLGTAGAARGVAAVFVEAAADLVGSEAEGELERLVKAARARRLLLVAEAETSEWSGGWGPLSDLRNARTGLLLQPEPHDGDALLRTQLPPFKQLDLPPGRGFWVRGARVSKVQIPLVR